MKTLAIFGSTGSIGKSSLRVFERNKSKFKLIYLSSHNRHNLLLKQSIKYKPKNILITNAAHKIKNKKLINIDAAIKRKKIDYVISGVSGYDALKFNLNLLKISKNLLIANKETIICGGKLFLEKAKKNRCNIIPIDSEHYSIFFFLKNFLFKEKTDIKKLFITASGGPFLKKKINYNETVSKALRHPIWKMGKKISIDSSTFSNKVMELFEAKILFNLNPKKLEMIVEDSSNIHSIIQLNENIYIPIMHKPNMELTISSSLGLRDFNQMINLKNLKIQLSQPNLKKFPVIKTGYHILNYYKHAGMILFTVFNERLVKMFLNKQIKYGDIVFNLVRVFKKKQIILLSKKSVKNLNEIYKLIKFAQNYSI